MLLKVKISFSHLIKSLLHPQKHGNNEKISFLPNLVSFTFAQFFLSPVCLSLSHTYILSISIYLYLFSCVFQVLSICFFFSLCPLWSVSKFSNSDRKFMLEIFAVKSSLRQFSFTIDVACSENISFSFHGKYNLGMRRVRVKFQLLEFEILWGHS